MMPTPAVAARENMVVHQVRGWDVVDTDVLDTLGLIPREHFVPPPWRSMAFADMAIPLGSGEVMMPPVVEGRMLQALALEPSDAVLEIGTGSGFITACLAHRAGSVTSLDIRPEFTRAADAALRELGITDVELQTAEAVHAWQHPRHYDAIVVTGAVAELPRRWLDWLAPEGRLFVITGREPIQCAWLLRSEADGQISRQSLFDTRLPYLQHAAPAPTVIR